MKQEKYTEETLALMARNQERADTMKKNMGKAWLLNPANAVKRKPDAKQPTLFMKGLV